MFTCLISHAMTFIHTHMPVWLWDTESTIKILIMICRTDFKTLLLLFYLRKYQIFLLHAKTLKPNMHREGEIESL